MSNKIVQLPLTQLKQDGLDIQMRRCDHLSQGYWNQDVTTSNLRLVVMYKMILGDVKLLAK